MSLTIFSSGHVLAADSLDQSEKIELRGFDFDDESLNKAIKFCDRSEEEIIELILKLAETFYSRFGNTGLQELYDKEVAKAHEKEFTLDAMRNVTTATFAALFDNDLNCREDFDHGYLVLGKRWTIFVKMSFPKADVGINKCVFGP